MKLRQKQSAKDSPKKLNKRDYTLRLRKLSVSKKKKRKDSD